MSIVTSGAYKGARVFTKTLFRQEGFIENLKIKGGATVHDLLTLSYKQLQEKGHVSSRFDLFKSRGRAIFKALAGIPHAAWKGIKSLVSRNKTKAEAAVS